MKFKVVFVHTEKVTYEVEVEADSKAEARKLIEEDPFSYATEDDVIDSEGINFEIKDVIKC